MKLLLMQTIVISNLRYKLCKFWLLILFFQSLYLYLTWGQLSNAIILIITLSHCLIFSLYAPSAFSFKRALLIPVVLFAIAQLYSILGTSFLSLIKSIIHIIIVGFVVFINDDYKKDLLQYFTKAVALILLVSLFAWVLFLIGISLPHSIVKHPDLAYRFDNYYLFLYKPIDYFPRFQSLFLEPGHLGMVTSFLLFANRFDLKRKEVVIILIATLFSFSLAAYLLTTLSVFIFILLNSNRKIVILITALTFLIISYFVTLNFNKGDNAINRLIISRYSKSNIINSNRFSPDFKVYYNNLKYEEYIFGIGEKYNKMKWSAGNAGYKVFIVRYGIVSILLVFLFYFSIVLYNKTKLALFFLIVYFLCFIQASYPLWLGLIFIFITSMPVLKEDAKSIVYGKAEIN